MKRWFFNEANGLCYLKENMDITDRLGILCLATDQQILLLISCG